MNMHRAFITAAYFFVGILLFPAAVVRSDNLVLDGGFEEIRTVEIAADPFIGRVIKDGCRFGSGTDRVILPANFDQPCGPVSLEVVEGEPGNEVHSGKRAIRVKGSFYLKGGAGESFRVAEGDIFTMRFWAKGKGDAGVAFALYGDGKFQAVALKQSGKPQEDTWTEINQTIMLTGPGVKSVLPRIGASGEMLLDDLVIRKLPLENIEVGRTVRPGELAKATCAFPTTTPPVVDGDLDEPCWKSCPAAGIFLAYGNQSAAAIPPTAFQTLYDDRFLYVGVTVEEPEMGLLDELAESAAPGDSWPGKHMIEIFLDPNRSQTTYFQFAASAKGHRYDGRRKDGAWQSSWQVKARLTPDRWTLEAAIPFADLGVSAPAIGDIWGLNVCRDRVNPPAHSTWNPVGNEFNNPSLFGTLVFGSYRQWYDQQFVKHASQTCLALREMGRDAGLPDLEPRLTALQAYTAGVDRYLKTNGFPATWPEFLALYAKASFVTESLDNLDRFLTWATLSAKESR